MKDPAEFQPPSGDRLFVVLRVEKSRHRTSFTPLDNVLLYLGHRPGIESSVSESPNVYVPGLAHVVNCQIAANTD